MCVKKEGKANRKRGRNLYRTLSLHFFYPPVGIYHPFAEQHRRMRWDIVSKRDLKKTMSIYCNEKGRAVKLAASVHRILTRVIWFYRGVIAWYHKTIISSILICLISRLFQSGICAWCFFTELNINLIHLISRCIVNCWFLLIGYFISTTDLHLY